MKRRLARNTPAEEAAIRRGIAADPATFVPERATLAAMRPAAQVMPGIVAAQRRARGAGRRPAKVLVSLRIERDVLDRLRASGKGWQTRVASLLRAAVMEAGTAAPPLTPAQSPASPPRPAAPR